MGVVPTAKCCYNNYVVIYWSFFHWELSSTITFWFDLTQLPSVQWCCFYTIWWKSHYRPPFSPTPRSKGGHVILKVHIYIYIYMCINHASAELGTDERAVWSSKNLSFYAVCVLTRACVCMHVCTHILHASINFSKLHPLKMSHYDSWKKTSIQFIVIHFV